MAVTAQNGSPLAIDPTAVRYSLTINKSATRRLGNLNLQRAQANPDGTWLDDPTPSARKMVGNLPAALDTALDALEPVLAAIATKLGVASYTDYHLVLQSILTSASKHDVLIGMQFKVDETWVNKTIQSLTAFLTANPDLAAVVLPAWDTLDTAVSAANQVEKWV